MKVSQWFNGQIDSPERTGVYQVKSHGGKILYCHWDGETWAGSAHIDPKVAQKDGETWPWRSATHVNRWRGSDRIALRESPSGDCEELPGIRRGSGGELRTNGNCKLWCW